LENCGGWVNASAFDGFHLTETLPSGNVPAPMQKLAAIVLAAGQGTRMRSKLPKILHQLEGRALVHFPVELALGLNASPVVVVTSPQAENVERSVSSAFPKSVSFQVQEKQRGTADAVKAGLRGIPRSVSNILILYGDVPLLTLATLKRLIRGVKPGRPIAFVTAQLEKPAGYGRVVRERKKVIRIVEHKDAGPEEQAIQEVNAGIYCIDAAFLRKSLEHISTQNAQGEFYLTDLVSIASSAGQVVSTVTVEDSSEIRGVNTRSELVELHQILRFRTLDLLMASGVTVLDPSNTYVSHRASIGMDTVIEPGAHIRGQTRIGTGCRIGVGCIVEDSVIGSDVHLAPYSIVEQADVQKSVSIGPFARLRPGTRLETGARVGNFVELKNTTLGEGSKANHLAYLGDADIKKHVNIGAGTITCNYDGTAKHKTIIDSGVFIGSNATLVAPLEIERDAYIAAGSTITDRVSRDDLAFGRARQVNKSKRARILRKPKT
jgi:bifunctional UDP-N-acetylglucosamine pyrophosphorylase / glucosamine-1-phosphate N-acetyltransferase